VKKFLLVLLFASVGPPLLALDDHNPIGVTGAFEGVITTGGAYNVLNHSATRQIDDIVVPGSIGTYPLKMTRYYNSRRGFGDGWSHEYAWSSYNGKIAYPNGTVWDSSCTGDWGLSGPLGVSDWPTTWNGSPAFRLADGGTIVFGDTRWTSVATKVVDPYGQITTITLDSNSGLITRVTEPGSRYLQFTYNGSQLLTRVDAYDGQGHHGDWVVYHYTAIAPGGGHPSVSCLTSVDYSDGTHAYYTYQGDNAPEDPLHGSIKGFPLVIGCDDVRYHGPMRRIAYVYQDQGPHGAILKEKYWDGVAGNEANGPTVSRIDPPAPSPTMTDPNFDTTYTEYRGDGPTRTFTYTSLHLHRFNEDTCPTWNPNLDPAPQQFLRNYTDFQGHTTYLGYDTNWYINSVRDANNNTTSYTRGPRPPGGIGQITQVMHPGNTHIDYTYQAEPGAIGGHYLTTVTNERRYVTTYNRNGTTHRIYEIDYPENGGYETFTYNSFGQLFNHRLRNGAYERFAYDNRGLLTDKWNPKQNAIPVDTDPHIHYTYYTSGPWTDRVQTMTLPPNFPLNLQATETYEYDRALGADGTTNPTGTAVAGRGLITRITHADNTYQSFGYDAYGNKRWEENELRQRSNYTYDDYNRLLTAKNPLNKTTTYTYTPTNGGGGSSYKHATSNPDTVTTPTGIVTKNVYDENFRKTSSTAAYGTALAATTGFTYDNVDNLMWVTDPLTHQTYNTYDARNRKLTATEAYGTSLARTTTWHYDAASNIYQIDRPDGTMETRAYDELNRMTSDTVPKTNSVNLVTYFDYNPSGTIQKITDPNGHYTWLYYDASDRKITMTYHDGSTEQWAYDDAGNQKWRITVNGETQDFCYNIRNFKYANWWSNWDDSIRNPDWCYFAYDAVGRLTEAENGTNGWGANIISDLHRSYDAAGHLTLDQQIVTGLGTANVNYPTYDGDGKLTRMYVSGVSGYDFTYSYDAMGRFEKIFLTNSSQLFQYRYDAASNEIERDNLSNGVNQLYPRDALNRMRNWDLRKGNSTLGHEGYTYDAMNRITIVDWANGHTDSFTYYQDGELNQAILGNFSHTLTYNLDKMGNRTSVMDNSVTSTYSPNTINQYTSVTGSSISNGSEHEIRAFNGVTYGYINDERLRSAASGSTNYSMVYDAFGRCVKRSLSNGPTTYYLYDGEKSILEYDAGGAPVGVNVYGKGIDEILERVAVGSDSQWHTFYLQQNHEGSVTHLTDSAGSVIEKYRYDAFGAPTIYAPNWSVRSSTIYDNRFLFTGREYAATYRSTYTTPAFNFYEYRARAYNPTLGRFMSEDPKLFDAGDYNLFRYCHNDPIDFTDPMGLDVAGPAPTSTIEREAYWSNARDAMAKWADSSNNFQGTFAQFAARQSLSMGQVGQGMRVERAIPIDGRRDPLLDRWTEDRLATLRKPIRDMARSLIYHARVDLDLDVRIVHQGAFRTYAEQNDLHARGISPARGGQSFHNFGVAFDIGLFEGRRYIDSGSGYTSAGHLGERLGLEWGGSWSPRRQDPPHFQFLGGQTLSQIRARFEQGLSPIPGY
jgi:RHS repeat-associated protein